MDWETIKVDEREFSTGRADVRNCLTPANRARVLFGKPVELTQPERTALGGINPTDPEGE